MKKIMLFLLLLAPVIISQTAGFNEYNKYTIQYTDSIYYGGPGDSTWVVDLSDLSDFPVIFIDGNSNSPVDSVRVTFGVKVYNSSGAATDTTWGSTAVLKDSAFNVQATIVNNTVGKDYQVVRSAVQLMKFEILNYRGTATTRSIRLSILALIKKLIY